MSSAKTRIEWTFDPDEVRKLKAEADYDLTVDGPNLAAQAIRAGLVYEFHLFITTSVVGGGGQDSANGGPGTDLCDAETTVDCEE